MCHEAKSDIKYIYCDFDAAASVVKCSSMTSTVSSYSLIDLYVSLLREKFW